MYGIMESFPGNELNFARNLARCNEFGNFESRSGAVLLVGQQNAFIFWLLHRQSQQALQPSQKPMNLSNSWSMIQLVL